MTLMDVAQIFLFLFFLIILIKPLGGYMSSVYEGKPTLIHRLLQPLEHFFYRMCRIDTSREMDWKTYLFAMLLFNFIGFLFLYWVQRWQSYLPLNPQSFPNISVKISTNTALSFITNTNWQAYSGEKTLSYFTQMLGLTVQNFLSAATGMSILVAFIRGFIRTETEGLGNYWVDMTRSILYILLPLSFVFSFFLISQGVIQNLKPYQSVALLQPILNSDHSVQASNQLIPMGPVASQEAIKLLGSNGGGFFNTNSAHPFENPTPLSNFFEMIALLLIPAALCYTFGVMIKDRMQSMAILAALFFILIPAIFLCVLMEQKGNPLLSSLGINQFHFGNMEGKEVRLGVVNSALWATLATATSNGSVNAMLDSFSPMGGFVLLFLMHTGEVVFGGVGTGLNSLLLMIVMTVFISGLMIGRTPEYLGKKIEPFEMKMASLTVLLVPLFVLVFTGIAATSQLGLSAILNQGPHGFTEILYAMTSMGSNNGSAFAGLNASNPLYTTLGGLAIVFCRYWIAIPMLAMAGSLVRKKRVPKSSGTLETHTPLFVILLIAIIFILSILSFIPALILGPVLEHLILWGNHVQ